MNLSSGMLVKLGMLVAEHLRALWCAVQEISVQWCARCVRDFHFVKSTSFTI